LAISHNSDRLIIAHHYIYISIQMASEEELVYPSAPVSR